MLILGSMTTRTFILGGFSAFLRISGLCLLLGACASSGGGGNSRALSTESYAERLGIYMQYFDYETAPQDNFYRWVNGRWIDAIDLGGQAPSFGAFHEALENRDRTLNSIIQDIADKRAPDRSPEEQKILRLYNSYLDTQTVDSLGLAPLEPLLEEIAGIRNERDMSRVFGHLMRTGINMPFAFNVMPLASDTRRHALHIYERGLTIPARDVYPGRADHDPELVSALGQAFTTLFEAAGFERAPERAAAVVRLEARLAGLQRERALIRNDVASFNPFGRAALADLAPAIDWASLLSALGAEGAETIVLDHPDFATGLSRLIRETDISVWRDYLRAHLLIDLAEFLPADFRTASFNFFGSAFLGLEEQAERTRAAVQFVNAAMPDALGRRYVARFLCASCKAQVQEIAEDIRRAYIARIRTNTWLDTQTRMAALEKLDRMIIHVGYPGTWDRYDALQVSSGRLLENAINASRLANLQLLERLTVPVDRDEWTVAAQRVNASYFGAHNTVTIPAGLIQPPFFSPDIDAAVNYGAIGGVIAHEIAHAFDDQGRLRDASGKLENWWTADDMEEYEQRSARLARQYTGYAETGGPPADRAMGEIIGDLMGATTAYEAYRTMAQREGADQILGFTADQRFFLGWAQIWRRLDSPEEIERRSLSGRHALPAYRVNGILRNMDAFHAAFGTQPGNFMWLAPEQRLTIW